MQLAEGRGHCSVLTAIWVIGTDGVQLATKLGEKGEKSETNLYKKKKKKNLTSFSVSVWGPLGASLQSPSGLSCVSHGGEASVWPLCYKAQIGGVLQWWLSFWKFLPSPHSISGHHLPRPFSSDCLVCCCSKLLPFTNYGGPCALGNLQCSRMFFVVLCALPNHIKSIEFTMGGLQSRCSNMIKRWSKEMGGTWAKFKVSYQRVWILMSMWYLTFFFLINFQKILK